MSKIFGLLAISVALLTGCRETPVPSSDNSKRITSPEPKQGQANTAAIEQEFAKIMAEDELAQAEVEKWIRDSKVKRSSDPDVGLDRRIHERLNPIGKAYQDFITRFPAHAGARLSYGNFLNEGQDESGAQAQWEKALELDPQNADVYNNLAGRYSEIGPARKAFEFFSKAIELKPSEATYYHNFADCVYVLNKQAMKYYGLSEQQVYTKSVILFSNAAWLDPHNFTFASDVGQTCYAVKPFPAEEALRAWTNALHRARDEAEREEILVHVARVKMLAGHLTEARAQLDEVTNVPSAQLKANLLKNIELREKEQSP